MRPYPPENLGEEYNKFQIIFESITTWGGVWPNMGHDMSLEFQGNISIDLAPTTLNLVESKRNNGAR